MTLSKIIPSYLYEEYFDDDALQAFVASQNAMVQQYLDWMNAAELPIYARLTGAFLDFVALGLYGIERPSLPFGVVRTTGGYNTFAYNENGYDEKRIVQAPNSSGGIGMFVIGLTPIGGFQASGANSYATSDDVFKRVITWHFYKGDGKLFDIRWLKRRVARFLFGTDGEDFVIDQTYRISVIVSGTDVSIRVTNGDRRILGSSLYNAFGYNQGAYSAYKTTFTPYPPIPEAKILKAAIDAGILELPFQFNYTVTVT